MIPRMQLLNETIDKLKAMNPNTAIPRNQLRQLVLMGDVQNGKERFYGSTKDV